MWDRYRAYRGGKIWAEGLKTLGSQERWVPLQGLRGNRSSHCSVCLTRVGLPLELPLWAGRLGALGWINERTAVDSAFTEGPLSLGWITYYNSEPTWQEGLG